MKNSNFRNLYQAYMQDLGWLFFMVYQPLLFFNANPVYIYIYIYIYMIYKQIVFGKFFVCTWFDSFRYCYLTLIVLFAHS